MDVTGEAFAAVPTVWQDEAIEVAIPYRGCP